MALDLEDAFSPGSNDGQAMLSSQVDTNQEMDDLSVRQSEAFRNCALGVKRYFCGLCDFAAYFEQTLLDHKISDHEGGLAHMCQRCDRRFKEKQDVEHHILVEHLHPSAYWRNSDNTSEVKLKKFQCEECGTKFHQKWHLEKHKKLHKLQKQCRCAICHLSFPNDELLALHARKFHTDHSQIDEEAMHKCDICHRMFKLASSLKKHYRNCGNFTASAQDHRKQLSGDESEDQKLRDNSAQPNLESPGPVGRTLPTLGEARRAHVSHLTCQFCDEVFENFTYLKEHLQETHMVKESKNLPTYPPRVSLATEDLSSVDMRTEISFDQDEVLSEISELPSVATLETSQYSASEVSVTDSSWIPKSQSTSQQKTNRCLICLKSFANFSLLKSHVSDVHKTKKTSEPHEPQPRKCLICRLELPSIEALKEHVAVSHALSTSSNVTNRQMGDSYDSNDDRQPEAANDSENFPDFQEFVNTTGEIDMSNIDQSFLLTDPSPVKSAIPKLEPTSATEQDSANDRSPTEYWCSQCNRSFKYKWNFDRDQEMHNKMRKKTKSAAAKASGRGWMLDCPHCSETFVDKIARIQHIKKAHEAQPKHNCELCSQQFPRRHLLISHIETDHV